VQRQGRLFPKQSIWQAVPKGLRQGLAKWLKSRACRRTVWGVSKDFLWYTASFLQAGRGKRFSKKGLTGALEVMQYLSDY
jgi:hypothetical protein